MQMITDHFDAGAHRHPDNICLQGTGFRLTYSEVQAHSHAIGHALTRLQLQSAHVGVLAPNHPLSFVAMLGALRAGTTFVPLNARDSIDSLIWFMSFTQLSVLVLHSQFAEHVERIRAGVPTLTTVIGLDAPIQGLSIADWCHEHAGQRCSVRTSIDHTALIKSSGGTTGRPKAIMQSHRALLACYRISNQFMPPSKPSAHLVVAPLTHAAGATAMALSSFGTRNVIAASAEPGAVLETIERERITHLFLPPTLIYRLLSHPDVKTRDCSSLEYVIYGAAPMSVDKLREGIALWGPVFVQAYGQSEVPGVITLLTREDHMREGKHLGSAGRPTGACEVALMDDEGRFVEAGERGEIVARGELVAPGYFDNPQANVEARRHGWHHTGDIGVFDESGYLYIVDRTKDMIISGGFNIYPSEIEQVIWAHPAVMDCAVVGIPDADWGEKVVAVIELKAGTAATAQEFIATCRDKLGSLKTPKQVLFWESLPRSPVGKVLKKDVRAQLVAQEQQA